MPRVISANSRLLVIFVHMMSMLRIVTSFFLLLITAEPENLQIGDIPRRTAAN
jgi:hypothetical protein